MGQLVTPEEAKKRWCRYGFGVTFRDVNYSDGAGIAAAAVNRTTGAGAECECLGPDRCMHWDWWDEKNVGDARRGYCGADGKPNKIGNENSPVPKSG